MKINTSTVTVLVLDWRAWQHNYSFGREIGESNQLLSEVTNPTTHIESTHFFAPLCPPSDRLKQSARTGVILSLNFRSQAFSSPFALHRSPLPAKSRVLQLINLLTIDTVAALDPDPQIAVVASSIAALVLSHYWLQRAPVYCQ